jgi:hypothetical protein
MGNPIRVGVFFKYSNKWLPFRANIYMYLTSFQNRS